MSPLLVVILAGIGPAQPIDSSSGGDQFLPAIGVGGDARLVVWTDTRSGLAQILGRFVDPDGRPLGNTFDISSLPYPVLQPALGWNGEHFLVAWTCAPDDGGIEVRGRLVSPDGGLPGGVIDVSFVGGSNATRPLVASHGGGWLVAYTRETGALREVRGVTLDPAGARTSSLLTLSPGAGDFPSMVWNGSHYVLAWVVPTDAGRELLLRRFEADAAVVDVDPLVVASGADAPLAPSVAAAADGGWLVSWVAIGSPNELWVRRYGADATPEGLVERVAVDARGTVRSVSASWDGRRGVIAWAGQSALFVTPLETPPLLHTPAPSGLAPSVVWRAPGSGLLVSQDLDAGGVMVRRISPSPDGLSCTQGWDCASAVCVSGVCCATACAGACSTGVCEPPGTPDAGQPPGDAGSLAGRATFAVGCGCASLVDQVLTLLVLLALRRRSTSR